MKAIRIISVPKGEAPEGVRRAWVGLVLPLSVQGRRRTTASGVLTGGKTPLGMILAALMGRTYKCVGYYVESAKAVEILAESAPEAARWWRDHAPWTLRQGRRFIFLADQCEEVEAAVWPPPVSRLAEAEPDERPRRVKAWQIGAAVAALLILAAAWFLWFIGVVGP
jgi:hypothetical protein